MSEPISVERVPVPAPSLVSRAFERTEYADAFRARVPTDGPCDVDAFARAMLTSMPAWIDRLMRARDAAVGLFGLKTDSARAVPDRFEPGASVGLFQVFARTDDEILFGADDSHLDFRLSCLTRDGAVTMTTIVRFHGIRGRAYFTVVRPFHERIVPAMLRSALR